ncbi:MAG: cobyrinate a,c-diamide synthase [Pseudomonadota bacterium]
MRGLIVSATRSGSGKTLISAAIARILVKAGCKRLGVYKVGPDYIDPGYLALGSGSPAFNLDPWAMAHDLLGNLLTRSNYAVIEGAMGLFDGGRDGRGSTADLARITGFPVLLVVDARGRAQSIAAEILGFTRFDPHINIAGVILNHLGSVHHLELIQEGLRASPDPVPIIAALGHQPDLTVPARHLGLIQAEEIADHSRFLARLEAWGLGLAENLCPIDPARLVAIMQPSRIATHHRVLPIHSVPFMQLYPSRLQSAQPRLAIARDQAFAFCYQHWLLGFEQAGIQPHFFSPLADEAPVKGATHIFLPGGYPELYGRELASARNFHQGLKAALQHGALIYGECGGYMVLGRFLIDGDGVPHQQSGLLPITTSIHTPKRILGYREIRLGGAHHEGIAGHQVECFWAGHEFHFARIAEQDPDQNPQASMGLMRRPGGSEAAQWRPFGHQAHCGAGAIMAGFAHCISKLADRAGSD